MSKPRFVVKTERRLVPLRQSMNDVVAHVLRQSANPLFTSEHKHAMRTDDRMSDDPHARVKRQAIRGYGSLTNFALAAGLAPYLARWIFEPSPATDIVANWKKALGLPLITGKARK
jgi:hypothetical protein